MSNGLGAGFAAVTMGAVLSGLAVLLDLTTVVISSVPVGNRITGVVPGATAS